MDLTERLRGKMMADVTSIAREERVLVLAPTARDSLKTRDILYAAGVPCQVCATLAEICLEAQDGAGAAIVTAEAILADAKGHLKTLIENQAPWSDLPLIVLTPPGIESPRLLQALDSVGSMTLMKRPVQVSTIVSAVRRALRDRHRQYTVRDHVAERVRSEAQVRASEERLRIALKGGKMGTWDLDLGSGILTCSDTCKSNFGRDPEQTFTYEELAAAVVEDDREMWRKTVAEAIARSEDLAVEYRIRWPDNSVHWVHVRASCVKSDRGDVTALTGVSIDISELKRAQDVIADREFRYRLVADAANDAIWDWNLATDQVVWNEGVHTLFGYEPDEVQSDASWWVSHIHPDDVERVTKDIHDHIDHGPDEWNGEYRFRHSNGSYSVVLDRGRVVRDASRNGIRMVGSMLDLTEKREAEKKLKESEERFNFVRESSGVGFWYCDLPFDVLEWDERVKAHFHLPKDARVTIGTFYDRLHPEDRVSTRAAIERSIEEKTPYDVAYRTQDPNLKTERWIRAIGRTFYADDGSAKRFDGITVDITDQKRAELSLASMLSKEKERTALLERVANASHSVNSVLSADSIVRIVTEEARAIIGAERGVTTFSRSEDGQQETIAVAHVDTTRNDPITDSGRRQDLARRVSKDNRTLGTAGDSTSSSKISVPLVGHGGRNLGVLSLVGKNGGGFTSQDEAVIGQLAAIASVGIENARLYERLRDQDRRKDEFLATLAHELRNPLAPIRTGLQIIRSSPTPEQSRKTYEMIERQVSHMVRLIDDLLDVSRITSGKVHLRLVRTSVKAIFEAALEVSRPLIEAGHHEVSVLPIKETFEVNADPTRLAQIVSNLLNNAAKYTPDGGKIELSAERKDENVLIRVQDNGVGIASDMLPKVFELFTQVGRGIDRSQGGLGIGLALVARLVEMHGGTVVAESAGLGEGSVFTIKLPLIADAVLAPSPNSSTKVPRHHMLSRRILVVDDNLDGAESLAMLLDLSGHTTETAHSGPEAVQLAHSFRPEIVFLDIGLPGMNGYEVAARLRANSSLKDIILVALTGWGTEGDKKQAKAAGFDYHLTKPVDAADVESLLSQLCGKKHC